MENLILMEKKFMENVENYLNNEQCKVENSMGFEVKEFQQFSKLIINFIKFFKELFKNE